MSIAVMGRYTGVYRFGSPRSERRARRMLVSSVGPLLATRHRTAATCLTAKRHQLLEIEGERGF